MRLLRSDRIIRALGAVAFTAVLLLAPHGAQASKALFRAQRYFVGSLGTYTYPVAPPTMGTAKAPPATAYVFPTANRFVLPKSFSISMGQYYCVPGQCFPGYPVSGGYYSQWNGQGRFAGGGASMGAPGPTTTATAVFPTTMGNNLPFDNGTPNTAMGNPVTPTTPHSGLFDFSRGGSIQVTPGPNRFSGTMRFVYGPNASFYQLVTISYPFTSRGYGIFVGYPTSITQEFGETDSTGSVRVYQLTPGLQQKATDAYGYISKVHYYLHLNIPYTTGMIEAYNFIGYYQTRFTATGGDDKNPAHTPQNKVGELYPTRIVSLVHPRLVHAYEISSDPNDPIRTNYQAVHLFKMDVFFLPEPGEVALLASGIIGLAGLAGLARLRRRR